MMKSINPNNVEEGFSAHDLKAQGAGKHWKLGGKNMCYVMLKGYFMCYLHV